MMYISSHVFKICVAHIGRLGGVSCQAGAHKIRHAACKFLLGQPILRVSALRNAMPDSQLQRICPQLLQILILIVYQVAMRVNNHESRIHQPPGIVKENLLPAAGIASRYSFSRIRSACLVTLPMRLRYSGYFDLRKFCSTASTDLLSS